MTHVCVCISRTHPHKPPCTHQAQEHTHSNMCAACSAPDREGNANKDCLCTPGAHTHTGAHVSSLRHIFMFLLHTCRTQKHSHRHLHGHSLPKHQCTHSYAHTPCYTNTQILAAHIQVHTHSCVHLCTHSHPLHPHEHTQGSTIRTRAQIRIHICPYQSGSLWFTCIPVSSKQNIYIQVYVKTHTSVQAHA